MADFKILPFGDTAVTVNFGDTISEENNYHVRSLSAFLEKYKGKGVVDLIPAFVALTVVYDSDKLPYKKLCALVSRGVKSEKAGEKGKKTVHVIPVCYGGEYGEDLADVAKLHALTESEVIALHSGRDYLIYMLGFLPGFPYLGGMDERLVTPRLDSPRTLIPAGSVGIGGNQTGMYPMPSPGGWRLIGRTPEVLYDAKRTPAVNYAVGEYIRFKSVSKGEYLAIEQAVKNGTYVHEKVEE